MHVFSRVKKRFTFGREAKPHLDADNPENLLSDAYVLNGLDRNAITTDNIVNLTPNTDSIFNAADLSVDPKCSPDDGKTWWQRHWKKAVQWIVFAAVLITSLVLMCIPGTQPFGAAMFAAGMKCAVSGFIIGSVIGGIASSIRGNGFMEGAAEGALYGAINGFSAGAIMYCVSQGVSAIANAANRAKVVRAFKAYQGDKIVIGEGMDRVTAMATKTGASYYEGLHFYGDLAKLSPELATQAGLTHNGLWLLGQTSNGALILDIGIKTGTSISYAFERALLTAIDYSFILFI